MAALTLGDTATSPWPVFNRGLHALDQRLNTWDGRTANLHRVAIAGMARRVAELDRSRAEYYRVIAQAVRESSATRAEYETRMADMNAVEADLRASHAACLSIQGQLDAWEQAEDAEADTRAIVEALDASPWLAAYVAAESVLTAAERGGVSRERFAALVADAALDAPPDALGKLQDAVEAFAGDLARRLAIRAEDTPKPPHDWTEIDPADVKPDTPWAALTPWAAPGIGLLIAAEDGGRPVGWLPTLAEALEALAGTGEAARKEAGQVRKEAERDADEGRDPLRHWYDPASIPVGGAWLPLVTRVLWHDVVKPGRERERRNRPAITRATLADQLLPAMCPQGDLFDPTAVHGLRGEVLGRMVLVPGVTAEAFSRGMRGLQSVHAHRFVHRLVHRSHDAWLGAAPDFRRVVFEGGWRGLAAEIGYTKKDTRALKEIVQAGACIQWATPHARGGGLWLWDEYRGSRAGPGAVSIVVGEALAPGLASRLKAGHVNTLQARQARQLVPELRYEPPMAGVRGQEQGAVYSLARLVVLELVDRAEELHKHGAARISKRRWRELAKLAGVPASILDRVIAGFLDGDDRTPPLLTSPRPGWYTLADAHDLERDFVNNGGAKRAASRRNGRKPKRRG